MPKCIANIQSVELLRGEQAAKISPLMLCDHLIQVAQEADQRGGSVSRYSVSVPLGGWPAG